MHVSDMLFDLARHVEAGHCSLHPKHPPPGFFGSVTFSTAIPHNNSTLSRAVGVAEYHLTSARFWTWNSALRSCSTAAPCCHKPHTCWGDYYPIASAQVAQPCAVIPFELNKTRKAPSSALSVSNSRGRPAEALFAKYSYPISTVIVKIQRILLIIYRSYTKRSRKRDSAVSREDPRLRTMYR